MIIVALACTVSLIVLFICEVLGASLPPKVFGKFIFFGKEASVPRLKASHFCVFVIDATLYTACSLRQTSEIVCNRILSFSVNFRR